MRKLNQNRIYDILFLIYLLILFRITVFRPGFSYTDLFQNGALNLALFLDYANVLKEAGIICAAYLFVGNIICFIPLGFYLFYRKPKKGYIWLGRCGLALSFGIEFFQYVLGTGVSELDDLILNTSGVLLGGWFVRQISRRIEVIRRSE